MLYTKQIKNPMRGFKHLLSSKLGFCLLVCFSIACTSTPTQHFSQPIDENLALDSTMLGISVIADNLDVPWEITWGPDNWIWITEQKGFVSRINPETGEKVALLNIEKDVWVRTTPGLLGMVVHPNQKKFPYVFINYTTERDSQYFSRLVRYTYEPDTLINPKLLLEIPASGGHNGSRLALSGDNILLWATGDIAKKGYAQDSTNLNGKILRMDIDGGIPVDNPIKGSYVWAWGFRNIQGMVLTPDGKLYTSEHGDAIEDEVNLVLPLHNYGWQNIEGFHDQENEIAYAKEHHTTEPIQAWTPTIAPAGLDYYGSNEIPEWKNTLLLTTLKGKSLRVLKLSVDGKTIESDKVYLEKIYGRIRDLCVSPAGDVYISTSNRDWNTAMGPPKENDDKILRIARVLEAEKVPLTQNEFKVSATAKLNGDVLYQQFCESCHKSNGKGVGGTFPALAGSAIVNGGKPDLIKVVLNGISTEGEGMPSFKFLGDLEISKILTYIRGQWGNSASIIKEHEVLKYR